MPIEIEKKYRLSEQQRVTLARRLPEIGAKLEGEEFEENILYDGAGLKGRNCVLRLRRIEGRAILTYKERVPGTSPIKRQREEETAVQDADAVHRILEALGYRPKAIYEKKRQTWSLGAAEVVLDELPFGLFMEIEGEEIEIEAIESKLAIEGLITENATYPELTMEKGKRAGSVVEARFQRD